MDKASLLDRLQHGQPVRYLMFWGHTPKHPESIDKSCLSQWFPAGFALDGNHYATAEHYMMARKALLFNDFAAYDRIRAATHPNEAKRIGREIVGFEAATWNDRRVAIVVAGNLAKFGQNPALKTFLLNTGDRVLVEASPLDRIWGIGLAGDDPKAEQPEQWRGLNLLGFALMQVRQHLRGET